MRASRGMEIRTGQVADTTTDGRGVVRDDGKTVFVHAALTGETVNFCVRRRRRQYDEGELLDVLTASPDRVEPRCAVYAACGGCSLQHVSPSRQIDIKQQALRDSLARIGGVQPERMLPAVTGSPWGYRRKARLAVKYVPKKGRVLVGFRERHQPFVTDTRRCETLHPAVGGRLHELSELIGSLSLHAQIPQIEVAAGDDVIVLVLRILAEPTEADIGQLRAFQRDTDLRVYLQTGGPSTVTPLPGDPPARLQYRLPEFDVAVEFQPTDFIQVNAAVNEQMVSQAVDLLALDAGSSVLDLFAGLGNFTLPIARRAGHVLAVEGVDEMAARAAANAAAAGLSNIEYHTANLTDPTALDLLGNCDFDRVLLDPPRAGAAEVLPAIAARGAPRLLYVSCHPGTLARDAAQLTAEFGYRLAAAGVMDMFPQTSHVESMALFERSVDQES
ncbi:MAG: 23S rRNA (uracil(1939)-C(5))-methyltransferase RlmD [Gammaproteobacteria bacterium]|nr:23S rRNA (uracil(1939)-C(5))-methyltransferase RlmD [Gammaproteobacteria bacterium]